MGTPLVERVRDHLNKCREQPLRCHICSNTASWSIGHLSILRSFGDGGVVVPGGPVTPVVSVICDKCGATQFFNAMTVGLVDANGRIVGA